MKVLIPFACLAGGIAIGWFARPVASTPTTGAQVPTAAASGSQTSGSGETPFQTPEGPAHSTNRPEKPDNELTKAKAEAQAKENVKKYQEQSAKRLVDLQRKKFEARLAKLTADLNLTPAQQEQIRTAMEERFSKLGELFVFDGEKPEQMKQRMLDLNALMKSDGLDDAAAKVVTADQQELFTGFKTKERQGRIESRTLKSLGNLTNVIELTPEQRDSVYQVLSEESATREDSQKGPAMMNMLTESMGVQFDDELGLQDVMQEQMESQMGDGANASAAANLQKTLRTTIKERTEAKIEALRPHLTDVQLQQYRSHLETKASGLMNMMGGGEDEDGK